MTFLATCYPPSRRFRRISKPPFPACASYPPSRRFRRQNRKDKYACACYPPSRRFRSDGSINFGDEACYPPSRRFRRINSRKSVSTFSYPPSRRFRSHGWGFFAPALDIVTRLYGERGLGGGHGPSAWWMGCSSGRGNTARAVTRARRQAVAAGVKREKGYSINNKQGLPYSIPYSILLPQKGERSCHYLCQRKRKSFAVHTVNVIRR